mmetsp:Transcript_13185/g.22719  ORF Transcript_13185/g.22719 Transcript_13185/m.22719 type:complete len:626 (+) Transcript_13185:114-1991(+)
MRALTFLLLVAASRAQTFFEGGDYFQSAGGDLLDTVSRPGCPAGYQPIEDVKACKEVAEKISSKYFNAIYHYYPVNPFPNFCTTKNDDVNYFVNPEGVHTDPQVSVLCIKSSLNCSVTDGSGPSSTYPCVCGPDTCATGEVCNGNICEVIKGYYEAERKSVSCPTGYQVITDEVACQQVAAMIPSKVWGAVDAYTTVAHGCTTWMTDTVNYYVNPGGTNVDIDVSLLCISTGLTCSVTDGSGASSAYPCVCGTDTCAQDEICIASSNLCEKIPGYVETERMAPCPMGYQVITDEAACEQLAGMIPGEVWGSVYSYSEVAYGCTTMVAERVNYNVNPGGNNKEVENALLCINSNLTCDVSDGSGVSSSYPCVCGTDTCAQGEICVASANLCESIEGYYETEREVSSCPDGYQKIMDANACRELAGKLPGKRWGAVYYDTTLAHGCGTYLSDIVNYYVNPGGTNTDVENSLLCISQNLTCNVTGGVNGSTENICPCGADTCATGEVCVAESGTCQKIKGYLETERRTATCPTGYKALDEAACWELAKKLGKTWIKFPIYSGAASGCGTWNFDTVTYFDYPGGGAPKDDILYVGQKPDNVENALLCVSEDEPISYDQCLNPYTWSACI